MNLVLTADACLSSSAPDRSLSVEGNDLRFYLSEAVAAPVREVESIEALSTALSVAFGQDSLVVSQLSVNRALWFLRSLPLNIPIPTVVVESETEIGLDWDAGTRRVLSVTVDESSRIGYAALIGNDSNYGRLEFVEGIQELPGTLRSFLSQIHPSRRTGPLRYQG